MSRAVQRATPRGRRLHRQAPSPAAMVITFCSGDGSSHVTSICRWTQEIGRGRLNPKTAKLISEVILREDYSLTEIACTASSLFPIRIDCKRGEEIDPWDSSCRTTGISSCETCSDSVSKSGNYRLFGRCVELKQPYEIRSPRSG